MEKLDLGWGDPYFLLEILGSLYTSKPVSVNNLTYAPDKGDEILLSQIKQITEKTTGNKYKYYCITNGATQAINSIIRVWEYKNDIHMVLTSELGYPYYPGMIEKTILTQKKIDFNTYKSTSQERCFNYMVLIDSPSNPLGEQFHFDKDKEALNGSKWTLWDGVYHNKIYNACPIIQPKHDMYVGSFSKLLGLTGARVGWFATNNKSDFEDISKESLYENATVSKPSQQMIKDILTSIDLDNFMELGKNSLDQNREVLQKLSSLLGSDVQDKGMFYCAEVDNKMLKLFDKSNIKYVTFNNKENKFIRLNIGQTNDILNKAVQSILKNDRRK